MQNHNWPRCYCLHILSVGFGLYTLFLPPYTLNIPLSASLLASHPQLGTGHITLTAVLSKTEYSTLYVSSRFTNNGFTTSTQQIFKAPHRHGIDFFYFPTSYTSLGYKENSGFNGGKCECLMCYQWWYWYVWSDLESVTIHTILDGVKFSGFG